MHKHRIRAANFSVTKRSDVRIRYDGWVVARHEKTLGAADVKEAVQHAVASAKLEGVSLGKKFVEQLYREALEPANHRSGKERRAS